MARFVDFEVRARLADYEAVAHLAPAVAQLRTEAARVAPRLRGRRLWMVNSTEKGGGVAEMLPTLVSLLRELGVPTEWVVLESARPEFFTLTKRIHNLVHGAGLPGFSPEERRLYEEVNQENAHFLKVRLAPGDVLAVHDPQPLPLASLLRAQMPPLRYVWRCHIGLDEANDATRSAWELLRPYSLAYDRTVFSAPEYVPDFLASRTTLVYPAIDPLTAKNRELHLHQVVRVLANAALAVPPGRSVRPPFDHLAQRLQSNGTWAPALLPEDLGLLIRPIVTQVSRWDRLKGFAPLLRAFVELKRQAARGLDTRTPLHQRYLELARLVLVGPDPSSVADDPEGREVLGELREAYLALPPPQQEDIAVITLPMVYPQQNALMVNALQRASSIIVQNSLREGFGLTVTEGMWKRTPILSNSRACGPRHQVRDQVDGRLVTDPEDTEGLAAALIEMLADGDRRELWGSNAQRRVHEEFLNFVQLRRWLQLLEELL